MNLKNSEERLARLVDKAAFARAQKLLLDCERHNCCSSITAPFRDALRANTLRDFIGVNVAEYEFHP